jgi:uncharacterized protein (TIGR01777 family)
MRVALLGGSGFIGTALASALRKRSDEVEAISLRDSESAASRAALCDAIVNLAGEPIAQRLTDAVKRRILESRTALPRDFLARIALLSPRARVYVSASAVGYYGSCGDTTLDESSPPGSDFLSRVCIESERTALHAEAMGWRVACVRTGLALGHGGALVKMLPAFRLGIGGRFGTGKQWYSWIHIDDVVGIYLLAIDSVSGAINATAPNPVRNADFAATLGRVLHRPAFLPAPLFALRAVLGEAVDSILLASQRARARRAQESGYEFKFTELEPALRSLLTA